MASGGDSSEDVFSQFLAFPEEETTKRLVCDRCRWDNVILLTH